MQIHELTQPRKSQLDEIDMFGPGGLASEIGSAIRNPKQALGFTKDGKFSPGLAQQQADQSEYARRAATAAGNIQAQLKPPTLDQSLDKLKANPGAQQWINGIVAKWPAAAKELATTTATATPTATLTATPTATPPPITAIKTATTPATQSVTLGGKKLNPKYPGDAATLAALSKQGIKEAPEYTTPGGIVVPGGAKTASQTDTQAYAAKFRSWVDSQLKTTKLATLESDPEVKAKLEPLLQQIIAAKDNLQAQQKLVHDFFSYAVAANHVVQATTQGQSPEQGQDQGTVATGNEIAAGQQAVDTGLNKGQLYTLYLKANAAGGPRPKSTGNPFYDSLIAQIRGVR